MESGWSCVYANDIDPKKQQLYEAMFGVDDNFHLGDVWDTDSAVQRIEDRPFLATASFPCTDLSLAGHWKGFAGEHSSTLFGFTRILEQLEHRKPAVVMLENVTGFLTSQEGKDFESAVKCMANLGYWVDAFILDAKFFLPQSRPRVFVIGVHEDFHPTFGVRKTDADWFSGDWSRTVSRSDRSIRPERLVKLMESIQLSTGWVAFNVPTPNVRKKQLEEVIDLDDDQKWWDEPAVVKHHEMMSDRHRKIVDEILQHRGKFVGTIFRRKRLGKTRAEVRFDGVAGCLRTPKGGSARQIVIAIDQGRLRMRWMSPREYARLQGAGDFPLVQNEIQNLFGYGDAVCVPVISWIDKHVLTPLHKSITEECSISQ